MREKTNILLLLDGLGIAKEGAGNAVAAAHTPNLDKLMSDNSIELLASGSAVGLPEGQAGNSEVGHLTIGAGKQILQSLPRINLDIENGQLGQTQAYLRFTDKLKENPNKALHIITLLSDGGVHSHINHLLAYLDEIRQSNQIKQQKYGRTSIWSIYY